TAPALRPLAPQGQALLPVEPIHSLMVDGPSLTTQQYMQTPITVAHPDFGQLLQVPSQGLLPRPAVAVQHKGTSHSGRPAGPPLGHLKRLLDPAHPFSLDRRP